MNILVRGTKNSNSQNYADRILASLFVTSLTKYGKKTLILQTDSNHPVEDVLAGESRKATTVRSEFNFVNEGMDSLWKGIRSGNMSADDWSDACINISNNKKSGLDIAAVSKNKDFPQMIIAEFDRFADIVKSASQWYDVIYIFANGCNEELLNKLRGDSGLIQKEVVCIPQGPGKEEEPSADKYFAVKNYDEASKFNVKEMGKNYGKNVFPVPYNIDFRDACLEQKAIKFFATNKEDEENDENKNFIDKISNLTGHLLGIAEVEEKETNFRFRK